MKVNRHKKAFSLMEIVITIVVVGTMVSMAIPGFINFQEKTKSSEGKNILLSLLGAQQHWAMDNNGAYTNTLNNLDIKIPQSGNFCNPTVRISNPIASIKRKDSSGACGASSLYTLTINTDGTISCIDGSTPICSKISY